MMNNILNIGSTIAIAALFAGCNQLGNGVGGTDPNAAQTQAIGDSVVSEVGASTSSMTAASLVDQGSTVSAFTVSSATQPPTCVTVSPSPVVDTDGDGVPDNATYTFNCTRTRVTGGTTKVTGGATLSDPGVGFNLSLSNLTTEVKNGDGSLSYTAVRNGTRAATGSGTQITLAHNLNVTRTVTGSPTAAISNTSTLSFTAASGSSIAQGQPLPSGTITASGNYGWVSGSESFNFQLSTPTALSYDASCTSDLKITAGVLRATLLGTGANGFIRITFNGCGASPTVIFLKS
jgi:hypothetical protein